MLDKDTLLSAPLHGGGKSFENALGGVGSDAGIGDAFAVNVFARGIVILPTLSEKTFEHDPGDTVLSGFELVGQIVGHLGLAVVIFPTD